MQVNTYLSFNGQCEAAFKFYEQVLGGKLEGVFKYGGSPMQEQIPPEWHDKVMHATLMVKDSPLLGADSPPGQYEKPKGISVCLALSDVAEAERIFAALAKGGNVGMPIQETFWAARFGVVEDQFGIPWMVNCEQPAK